MFPEVFSLGWFHLRSYGLLLVIAFLVGAHVSKREANRVGLDPLLIGDLLFWALLSSILGARIAFVLTYFRGFIVEGSPWTTFVNLINITRGGLVFYGGFIGGTLALIVYCRFRKILIPAMCDLVGVVLPLGIAFGRVGCFLTGCCWGKVTDLPWAVRFPRLLPKEEVPFGGYAFADHLNRGWVGLEDTHSLPIHPTQLYETLAMVAFFFFLWSVRKRKTYDGQIGLAVVAGYAVWRFFNETLRGDNPAFALELTFSQTVSIVLLLLTVPLLLYHAFKRTPERPLFDFSTVPRLEEKPPPESRPTKHSRNKGKRTKGASRGGAVKSKSKKKKGAPDGI